MSKLLVQQEEANAERRAGFDTNCYWRVQQEDNEKLVITVAVDLARSLNHISHYNQKAPGKKFRYCMAKTYGEECEDCQSKDKNVSRQNQKRSILIYNHSVVGKKKKSKDGTKEYEPNPLQILNIGLGAGGSLMAQFKDLNGDLMSYYTVKKGQDSTEVAPDPEKLKENQLLFNPDTGKEQHFTYHKVKEGDKTSYVLTPISHSQAQKILGTDKQVKIPDEIRDQLNKLTFKTLGAHYLASNNFDGTDWARWELEPPAKGSRIGDPAEDESNSDSDKAKL